MDSEEVPVAAALFSRHDVMLSLKTNQVQELGDPTAHAEMLCLRDVSQRYGRDTLRGGTLLVSLEPCPMCAGAIVLGGLRAVWFAHSSPRLGSAGSVYDILRDQRLGARLEVHGPSSGTAQYLSGFFDAIRSSH